MPLPKCSRLVWEQQQSFTQKIFRTKTWLRLPREIESSHLLVMGDSGKGKSALIRQILLQIEERGETAIVYDPATPADYVPYFLTPSRGDLILNPPGPADALLDSGR